MDFSPLFISLKVAVIATVFSFFIGILVAFYVAKIKRFKSIVDGILTLPMVLPPTVVGFFLLLIFAKNGLLGPFFEKIGWTIVFTWQGAVLAAFVVSFPLMYRTARGAFEQMDQNLVYAAQTLGMTNSKIFRKIIIPECWPGIAAGVVLAFARALGEFGATSMVAGNIQGKTRTMSLAIYSAVAANNYEEAVKWVIIVLIISFTTIALMNYWTTYSERKRKKNSMQV